METIFKTRSKVPFQSLKCREDCNITLALGTDCRSKYVSSIEMKVCCRPHVVCVKFQLNRPGCHPAHSLGSPVSSLALRGCSGLRSPDPLTPPVGYALWAAPLLGYKLGQNHILENENLQGVKFLLPPSFPFPWLPLLFRSLGFAACC